eukprot:8846363-Pyramimonas_sp.AAC.1
MLFLPSCCSPKELDELNPDSIADAVYSLSGLSGLSFVPEDHDPSRLWLTTSFGHFIRWTAPFANARDRWRI